ncbi:hypothetical protein FGO68_gene1712 [Halteria grandinella]|uniref:Uncharacterized protein n=1 Tax=Halteria grandinella TaxID=5974 RepID=A0A8J8NIF7_HALGN|nr:hypothetical protein FGO68_gene1712 [Halteria grandinella]
MLKLFDQQNKQIEFMQQIIVSQTNQCELEEKIKNTINKLGQELEGRLKKMNQKEFQTIFVQLEALKTQIFQVNITNSKLISEKLHSSFEFEDYLQKQRYSVQNKKQENQDQRPKENHSFILNASKYENDGQSFQDITIPIKYIKSLQQSLQNSKISKCSSTNNTKQEEDSPIEVFCEQNLLDSLDNIKVFDPQNKSTESMECNYEIYYRIMQDVYYS